MFELSIFIPTYNREANLIRIVEQLKGLNLPKNIEIVILDNNSSHLIPSYEGIRIIRNAVNTGMSWNIVRPFLECRGKWLWILSDDDVLNEDLEFESILNDLKKYSDYSALIYSFGGDNDFGLETEGTLLSLRDLYSNYKEGNNLRRGSFVYLSNKIFNVHALREFLPSAFQYSYTHIGFLIPLLFALDHGGKVKLRDMVIVNYCYPGTEKFWSICKVSLALSTISHLSLNGLDVRRMLDLLMPVTYVGLFKFFIVNSIENDYRWYYKIYNSIYIDYLRINQKVLSYIFFMILRARHLFRYYD